MKKQLLIALLAPALFSLSCGTNDDMPTQSTYDGSAELTGLATYAAVGNSLTAGYQNGAWGNPDHVAHSFPNLIANQLGISNFKQVSMTAGGLTYIDADGDGVSETPAGNMVVNFDQMGSPVLSYTEFEAAAGIAANPAPYLATDLSAPRNFGIPGITLAHAVGAPLLAYAAGNPYAGFYHTTDGTLTQVGAAATSGANFITCWLGNNDVLSFVTSGGTGTITDDATFQASISGAIGALGAAEHLVVLNLPEAASIPFVTYFNPGLREMLAAAGMDPVLMVTDDDTGNAMPVSIAEGSGNYVLLPAVTAMQNDPMLGSPMAPLPDALVLDADELALAEAAVESFNGMIAAAVQSANDAGRTKDVILLDMRGFFEDVVLHGYEAFGYTYTADFVSGGIFSLDGVHPTSFGYAVIANQVIEAMNDSWGYDIMPVDLVPYMGAAGLGSSPVDIVLPDLGGMIDMLSR